MSILLALFFYLSCQIFPMVVFAVEQDLSPSINDLSQTFSRKFCLGIANGLEPENAGKTSGKQMVQGLIFSPISKEILATPKEKIASSLSKNIFNQCGDQLESSQEDLYNYLIELANRDRQNSAPKPFKPFGIG